MPESPRLFRFGIYEADLRSGELRKNGSKVRLQEQPFQVLALLLARAGDVVTREELRQRLWPADTFVDFDHSLNTAINKLREAVGDSAANPRFIETLAKRGYRFIAPVQAIDDAHASEVPTGKMAQAVDDDRTGKFSGLEDDGTLPTEAELPTLHRAVGRSLFGLLQVMYLSFYMVSLARLGSVEDVVERHWPIVAGALPIIILVGAVIGIPARLYLGSAVAFDYPRLGQKFIRLFPFIVGLDVLWALSPILLVEQIGIGLALAAVAALLYAPFAQRTLVRMTYRE